MSIDFIRPEVDELRPRITVIGVGGAGGNAIANMMRADVQGSWSDEHLVLAPHTRCRRPPSRPPRPRPVSPAARCRSSRPIAIERTHAEARKEPSGSRAVPGIPVAVRAEKEPLFVARLDDHQCDVDRGHDNHRRGRHAHPQRHRDVPTDHVHADAHERRRHELPLAGAFTRPPPGVVPFPPKP